MLTWLSLRPGLALSRWRAPSLTCLTDAGQIGRVEAFPAQEFANGLIAVLSFQVDLELLLGAQRPPLPVRGVVRSCRWIGMGHFSVSCWTARERQWFRSPYGLPPPLPLPPPCSVIQTCFEVTNSETAGAVGAGQRPIPLHHALVFPAQHLIQSLWHVPVHIHRAGWLHLETAVQVRQKRFTQVLVCRP